MFKIYSQLLQFYVANELCSCSTNTNMHSSWPCNQTGSLPPLLQDISELRWFNELERYKYSSISTLYVSCCHEVQLYAVLSYSLIYQSDCYTYSLLAPNPAHTLMKHWLIAVVNKPKATVNSRHNWLVKMRPYCLRKYHTSIKSRIPYGIKLMLSHENTGSHMICIL
jgi:hypothetical protein